MTNYLLINAGIKILIAVIFSVVLIRKDIYREAMTIFLVLFILGQIIGYVLGLDILKIVIPAESNPASGTVTQLISSTIFPFLLAFTIQDLRRREEGFQYGFYIRLMFLILIAIGFLQFLPIASILTNILLLLALVLGVFGLYQKYQEK